MNYTYKANNVSSDKCASSPPGIVMDHNRYFYCYNNYLSGCKFYTYLFA